MPSGELGGVVVDPMVGSSDSYAAVGLSPPDVNSHGCHFAGKCQAPNAGLKLLPCKSCGKHKVHHVCFVT